MQRLDYCPNCRAPVALTQRFCSHCGINLQLAAQRTSGDIHPLPVPYRTDSVHPQVRSLKQQSTPMEDVASQLNATISAGSNIKPLRREILKLLSSLVENQAINN